MTDETKKLFAAPYKVVETRNGYNVICTNKLIPQLCWTTGEKDANRLARLPELYDMLLRSVCSSCNICIYTHCCPPVDCEQLLSQDCTYEDSKRCFEHKIRKLLKKVRDGEK